MKLTLRDLFWMVLVVAVVIGGVREHQRLNKDLETFVFLTARLSPPDRPSSAAKRRLSLAMSLKALSNQQLEDGLRTASEGKQYDDVEGYLLEMANRRMVDELQHNLDQQHRRAAEDRFWDRAHDVESLTALRRAQGHLDPLEIDLTIHERRASGPIFVPEVTAIVKNVDVEKQANNFTPGGDYRSGRFERWRFVLTDPRGRVVEDSNFFSFGGGGLSQISPFKYGDSKEYRFDLREYLAPPRSGSYQLQALFHSSHDLADEPDLDGLIISKSKVQDVIVENANEPSMLMRLERHAPALTTIVCVVIATAGLRLTSQRLRLRDYVWSVLVVGLAVIWIADSARTHHLLDRRKPDVDASWSIKPAAAKNAARRDDPWRSQSAQIARRKDRAALWLVGRLSAAGRQN